MALTIGYHGSATLAASAATMTISQITASINDWLVVVVAADNAGTSGAASLQTNMTDSVGNVYTNRARNNNDPGAASAGCTLGIWTAEIAKAISAGSITVNFSPNTTRAAAVVFKVTPPNYHTVAYGTVGTGYVGSTTTNTTAAVSIPIFYTVFGCIALESTAVPTTADSDTTNGSWSSQSGAASSSGTAATSMAVAAQYKTVTATGNQTYNVTCAAAARDSISNLLTIYEKPLEYWFENGTIA